MARFALAGFLHETNTFSPIPTNYDSFTDRSASLCGIYEKEELAREFFGKNVNIATSGFYQLATQLGHQVVPLVRMGEAEPSGQVPADVFFALLKKMTTYLKQEGPFDGLFLDLHGAMVYEPYQPGEPEILRQVRAVVGDIPLVAALDLHGNIGRETFDLATALVGYRTYPHIDIYEVGQYCARLLDYLASGKPFYKSFYQLPFLMPGSTLSTNIEPCKSFYALIDEVEKKPQVLSATIMQGFNDSDFEDMGPSVFAYGSSQAAADWAAGVLYAGGLERESQFRDDLPDAQKAVAQAIALAKTAKKPVILADGQDNPGGGSSSDTTWIMEELLSQNAPDSAVALLFDPEAAEMAHRAGEGAKIAMKVGGKLTPGHKPLEGTFEVVKLFEGDFMTTGKMVGGIKTNLGKMAQLRIGNVRIVVASYRTQILDKSFVNQVGIEPEKMKILVLKSTNHYRADFEPLASRIIDVEAPSAMVNNPAKGDYKNLRQGLRMQGLGPVFSKAKK